MVDGIISSLDTLYNVKSNGQTVTLIDFYSSGSRVLVPLSSNQTNEVDFCI
jgi:hypothetical protein